MLARAAPARYIQQAHIPFGTIEWEARTASQTVPPLIAISDPKEHLRRRKPWNRALRVASLKELEPYVAHRAEQLVSRLSVQNTAIDLSKWFSWFACVFRTSLG